MQQKLNKTSQYLTDNSLCHSDDTGYTLISWHSINNVSIPINNIQQVQMNIFNILLSWWDHTCMMIRNTK